MPRQGGVGVGVGGIAAYCALLFSVPPAPVTNALSPSCSALLILPPTRHRPQALAWNNQASTTTATDRRRRLDRIIVGRIHRGATKSIVIYRGDGGLSSSSSPTVERDDVDVTSSTEETESSPRGNVMGGTDDFEKWFDSFPGSDRAAGVRHAAFFGGRLRGLLAPKEQVGAAASRKKIIATVPRKMCISVPYGGVGDERWDSDLAMMLLGECQLGTESSLYGYCSLLCQGVDYDRCAVPPSTAPDSLRHWTDEQRARLESGSDAGRALLRTEEGQRKSWNRKYDSISAAEASRTVGISREQFLWAMEAVHSRAFRGDFGPLRGGRSDNVGGGADGPIGSLANAAGGLGGVALQVVAAGVGLSALLSDNEGANLVAMGCGVVALAPLVASFVSASSGGGGVDGGTSTVLLPLVDSANHIPDADSVLEFDPIKDAFMLSAGTRCFVGEGNEDGKVQLYISYGTKSDEELLLNYGFLSNFEPMGVPPSAGSSGVTNNDMVRDTVRKQLAEEFARRYG